jgi:hypothetical protein
VSARASAAAQLQAEVAALDAELAALVPTQQARDAVKHLYGRRASAKKATPGAASVGR